LHEVPIPCFYVVLTTKEKLYRLAFQQNTHSFALQYAKVFDTSGLLLIPINNVIRVQESQYSFNLTIFLASLEESERKTFRIKTHALCISTKKGTIVDFSYRPILVKLENDHYNRSDLVLHRVYQISRECHSWTFQEKLQYELNLVARLTLQYLLTCLLIP
jgi:hypothetical protein